MIDWPKTQAEMGDFTQDNQPPLWTPPGYRLYNGRGFNPKTGKHTSWALFVEQEAITTRKGDTAMRDKSVVKTGIVTCVHIFVSYAVVHFEGGQTCEVDPSTGRALHRVIPNEDESILATILPFKASLSGKVLVAEGCQPDYANLVDCEIVSTD